MMSTKKRLIVVLSIVLLGLIGVSALTVYNYLDNFHIIEPCTTPEPFAGVKGRIVNGVTKLPVQDATIHIRNLAPEKVKCPEYDYLTQIIVQTNDLGDFTAHGITSDRMKFEFTISAPGCQTNIRTVEGDAFFESDIIPDGKHDFYLDC
jgi:hypothetical protein